MRKLKLERTIQEGFKDLGTRSLQEGGEALARLSRDLDQLEGKGKITELALRGLVSPNSASQGRIEKVVRTSLSSDHFVRSRVMRMFEPGASSIVMRADGSEIAAVHHDPNPSPKLKSYGNQLRWALQHAAYSAIAGAQRGVPPSNPMGYLSVENTIRASKGLRPISRVSDIPPKSRHHLGGHWRTDRPTMKDAIGPVVAATSGVLLNPYFLCEVRDETVDPIVSGSFAAAISDETLEGFDGNFLAGLNDTKVSINLLNGVFGGPIRPIELTEMMDLEDELDAINLH